MESSLSIISFMDCSFGAVSLTYPRYFSSMLFSEVLFYCIFSLFWFSIGLKWYTWGFYILFFFLFSHLIGSMIFCLTLIWRNSRSLLFQSFCSLRFVPSFCISLLHILHLCGCPTVFGYSILFFSVFIPFALWFWKFLLIYPQTQRVFLSRGQSTNMPRKTFFIPVTVFLISSI